MPRVAHKNENRINQIFHADKIGQENQWGKGKSPMAQRKLIRRCKNQALQNRLLGKGEFFAKPYLAFPRKRETSL